MNGYLRIKNTDLYERDGVTYWRNGGNIIGNVVKAVIEENDVITSETYYIESLKTAKAIMLDPDVKIGGLTASESKNGNFIIVETAPVDFTEYGGGAGLKITFIYGVNYYSIETVESNGDIKIYDPDGESGTITPDALPDTTDAATGDVLTLDSDKKPIWNPIPTPEVKKYYEHHLTLRVSGTAAEYIYLTIISVSNNAFNATSLKDYVSQFSAVACSGFFTSTVGNKGIIMNIFNTASNKCGRDMIKMYQNNDDKTITITRDATQATPWTDYTITDDIKEI